MQENMHSDAHKNKTFGGLMCSLFMSIAFAILFGYFAFPGSNPDTWILYQEKMAQRYDGD
jgi:hypothetical protein